jgi:hypothetical protein
MAFRASTLRALGGFDPALGPGTMTRAGEELAVFIQAISAGWTSVYEPGAIVRHMHRRDNAGLRKQMYGYGIGRSAYLTKCVFDRPTTVLEILAKIVPGLTYARRTRLSGLAGEPSHLSEELAAVGRKGTLLGPLAYLWSRRQARKWKLQVVPTTTASPAMQEHATDELGSCMTPAKTG